MTVDYLAVGWASLAMWPETRSVTSAGPTEAVVLARPQMGECPNNGGGRAKLIILVGGALPCQRSRGCQVSSGPERMPLQPVVQPFRHINAQTRGGSRDCAVQSAVGQTGPIVMRMLA